MARRSFTLATALVAALTLPVVPATAGGGGGCHGETTQGVGDTVEMVRACFTPTTLRISAGDTVTFVNRDPLDHNVVADGWGHLDDMGEGDAFTATFDDPGVYPYACMYHWGMTGAIVVGDGVGEGDDVRVASFEPPEPSPVVRVRTVGAGAAGSPIAWLLGGAIGLALGLGLGLVARALTRGRTAVRSAGTP
jgi:plastocyanin